MTASDKTKAKTKEVFQAETVIFLSHNKAEWRELETRVTIRPCMPIIHNLVLDVRTSFKCDVRKHFGFLCEEM